MNTAIYTFEKHHGKKDIGSSRIRGRWIVEQWKKAGIDLGDCELYKYGGEYDCIIFQKVYFPQFAKAYKGIKILDLCDADWLIWDCKMVEMIQEVDAITCSTLEIAKFIVTITDKPVAVIPDRINLETIDVQRKEHTGDAKTVAWFGYAENNLMLDSAIPAIANAKLDLIVVSNKPYIPPTGFSKMNIKNYSWNEMTVNRDLQKADMIINPQFKKGRWKYKSNNKTVQGWAIGLPVAHTDQELKSFIDGEAREAESIKNYQIVQQDYDIKRSVEELKTLIQEIAESKNK